MLKGVLLAKMKGHCILIQSYEEMKNSYNRYLQVNKKLFITAVLICHHFVYPYLILTANA
jgi:hypothetical protein